MERIEEVPTAHCSSRMTMDGEPLFVARVRSVGGDDVQLGKLRVGRGALVSFGGREAQHHTKDPIRRIGWRHLQCRLAPVVAVIMASSACATSWSEQEVAALLEANESALQKLVEEFAQEPRIYEETPEKK